MATRLYFHGNGPNNMYVPSVEPAYSAEWERTTAAVRRYLSKNKRNTVNSDSAWGSEYESGPQNDTLLRQFISDPLDGAQTISGTVKGQIRCRESDAAADFCRALVIKVVSGDGSTVRGVLLSHFPDSLTSEFATSLTNRNFPPSLSLNQVEAQDGDRIVVELGFRAFNNVTTTYTAYLHLNDWDTYSDLPHHHQRLPLD